MKPEYPKFKFCPKCATKLEIRSDLPAGEAGHAIKREYCPKCAFTHYVNPAPAAAVVIQEDNKVLLVRRKFPPFAGLWQFPAGFVEWGETPEETAVKEAEEEAGVKVALQGLFAVEKVSDDPREEIVLIFYNAQIISGKPKAGSDADRVGWFSLDNLPKFGSRSHKKVLEKLKQTYTPGV